MQQNFALLKSSEYFVYNCWSIWQSRNKVVREGRRKDPGNIASFAANYVVLYKEPHIQYHSRPLIPSSCWKPLDGGILKINFDASVYHLP